MDDSTKKTFKPYISATDSIPEFTLKAILLGSMFGIIFGATGFAGVSMSVGKTLLLVFLVLSILSFLGNLISGGSQKRLL